MQFLEPELFRIAREVFLLTIGLDVRRAERLPPAAAAGRTFLSSVQISGAWEGVVQLHAPEPLVARAAAAMFSVPSAETTLVQRQDALGELANMLGGNVKALLPEPCRLSLPTVVVGLDYDVRVPSRTRVRTQLAMACAGDAFVARVLESDAS